uniref:Uncharacterized protein n=1 Tax=Parastrongyloides trichosuri TaxID=131310 RepID=A0A0N4Z6W1_PARTI
MSTECPDSPFVLSMYFALGYCIIAAIACVTMFLLLKKKLKSLDAIKNAKMNDEKDGENSKDGNLSKSKNTSGDGTETK